MSETSTQDWQKPLQHPRDPKRTHTPDSPTESVNLRARGWKPVPAARPEAEPAAKPAPEGSKPGLKPQNKA